MSSSDVFYWIVRCVVPCLIVFGVVRRLLHHTAEPHGDADLVSELSRIAPKHTRRMAAVVVDGQVDPVLVRQAFIDCDESTMFEIGSVSKALTGLLVADLADAEKIDLDVPISTYLPQLRGVRLGDSTMRDLCTHRSGLPTIPKTVFMYVRTVAFSLFGTNPYRGLAVGRMLKDAARCRRVAPGSFRYSNVGAAVAGAAASRAVGELYEQLLSRRVLEPAGMDATRVSSRSDHVGRGWRKWGRRSFPWVLGGYAPAGGVISNARDMGVLATTLALGTAPGMSALTTVDGVSTRASKEDPNNVGLFWMVDRVAERHVAWHNGQTGGYSSFIVVYPEAKRAVVVLANTADADALERVARQLTRWMVTAGKHSTASR